MANDIHANPPIRRTWLNPWRWSRWTWCAILLFTLIIFVFYPPILVQVAVRTGFQPKVMGFIMRNFVAPHRALMKASPAFTRAYQQESEAIDYVFGRAPFRIIWANGNALLAGWKPPAEIGSQEENSE